MCVHRLIFIKTHKQKTTFGQRRVLLFFPKRNIDYMKIGLMISRVHFPEDELAFLFYEKKGRARICAPFFCASSSPCTTQEMIFFSNKYFLLCNKKSRFDFADKLKVGDVRYKHLT